MNNPLNPDTNACACCQTTKINEKKRVVFCSNKCYMESIPHVLNAVQQLSDEINKVMR